MSPKARDRLAGAIVCACVLVCTLALLWSPEISTAVRAFWR